MGRWEDGRGRERERRGRGMSVCLFSFEEALIQQSTLPIHIILAKRACYEIESDRG